MATAHPYNTTSDGILAGTQHTNGHTLDRLERVVRWADDFVLAFVKCNHPAQREELRSLLLKRLEDKRVLEIVLEKPIVSLLDAVTEQWDATAPPDAVCIYGLEKSINEQREASPVMGRLNNDRELLREAIPVPLLIWLPDFALDCVARGAPDFWAWRSGVYEFETNVELWHADGVAKASDPDVALLRSLSFTDKQQEVARLQEMLRAAQSLPQQGSRELNITAGLLNRLGIILMSLGRYEEAETAIEQALLLAQELDHIGAVAALLHQFGVLKIEQGDFEKAEQLLDESLRINQKLKNDSATAMTKHQLATIYRIQGDWERASHIFRQNLQSEQGLLDDKLRLVTLNELGALELRQGNLQEAQQLLEQGLETAEGLHDQRSAAVSLFRLSALQQGIGDLLQAEKTLYESLRLFQHIGDIANGALVIGQLGTLFQAKGEWRQALYFALRSWQILAALQQPFVLLTQRDVQNIRNRVGQEQFEAWLREDFPKDADDILAALQTAPEVVTLDADD